MRRCFKMTLSNVICNILSTTVIAGGLFLKIPQIVSVVKAGNTQGISWSSVILEECAYTVKLAYNVASGYPLMTYVEFTILVLQDLLLIFLILQYNKQFSIKSVIGFIIYSAVFSGIAFRLFPDLIVNASVSFVVPFSVISKAAQIRILYTKKDSGQLSLLTWCIAAYGCIARVITTALQTGDIVILVDFLFAGFLNVVIVSLIITYSGGKKDKTK